MINRMRAWWIRLLNKLPRRAALIKRMSSPEWEQQQIVDSVLGAQTYEPSAWWRLKRISGF